jgi:hypothetical protein
MGDQMKKVGQMKMRRDGWMGAMSYRVPNLRVPVYHPCRTPLFKFYFDEATAVSV